MSYDARLMKKIGIDIFSGAGGLSLGGSMAGIKVRYAIEVNPHAAKSFELNHKGAKVICGDIRDVKAIDFLNKDEEVFIIMGGPLVRDFLCQIRCLAIWTILIIYCSKSLFVWSRK